MITVWSDIHCPWAAVTVHRLRQARDEVAPEELIDQRPWPLEWVNSEGTPRHVVVQEAAVLANHEPELFSAYSSPSWPSTFLPAFELVAAARRVHGIRAAEDVDYALRLAFFRDSVDVSIEAGLSAALKIAASLNRSINVDNIIEAWRTQPVRADVFNDYQASKDLPIQGSPQIFWPNRKTTHNPGLTNHAWVRGIPRIESDDTDAPRRVLVEARAPTAD